MDKEISAVGGIIAPEEMIQLMLLGANCIQLSSVIAWKNLHIIKTFEEFYLQFIKKYDFKTDEAFIGKSLDYILPDVDSVYNTNEIKKTQYKVTSDCLGCKACACADKLCLAFKKSDNKKGFIDGELCSGCGWCEKFCIGHAVVQR